MENKEHDRFLPIANIGRIMKKALPDNAKIAKDAKETVQECVSEFISFITSEACEKCKNEKRKTINGDDLLYALNTLGFENYVEILKLYLQKYRDVQIIIYFLFFFGLFKQVIKSQEKNQQLGTNTAKTKKKKKLEEENKNQQSPAEGHGPDVEGSQIRNEEDDEPEQEQEQQQEFQDQLPDEEQDENQK